MTRTIFIVIASVMGLMALSLVFRACSDASDVLYNEYKASTLLDKYEKFKDYSAEIDARYANLLMFKSSIQSVNVNSPEYPQLRAELMGIISSYNNLCAEYNSQMSKFNYRFCNAGSLPEGASVPLPREYKPYLYTLK